MNVRLSLENPLPSRKLFRFRPIFPHEVPFVPSRCATRPAFRFVFSVLEPGSPHGSGFVARSNAGRFCAVWRQSRRAVDDFTVGRARPIFPVAAILPPKAFGAARFRLWNPFQFCGTPFVANAQSAVFYPLNLPFWIFDTAYAFGIVAFSHSILASFSTYFLARRWGLSRAAGVMAGAIYAFSGYMSAWALLPTLFATAAWLPLCVLLFEKASDDEKPAFSSFALALCLACALLAGHAQIFFYILAGFAVAPAVFEAPVARIGGFWRRSGVGVGAGRAAVAADTGTGAHRAPRRGCPDSCRLGFLARSGFELERTSRALSALRTDASRLAQRKFRLSRHWSAASRSFGPVLDSSTAN